MKDKLSIFLYNIFRFVLKKLPDQAGRYLGKLIAFLAYFITPERREHSRLNLKRALNTNDQEAKRLIKKVYRNLGYDFTEFLMEDKFTENDIDEMVNFEGLEYLEQALKEERGVIIYTAHLGNWELMGAVLALKGYRVHSIAQEQNNSLFDEKINAIRSNVGVGIIPKGLSIRKAFKVLKANEILAILGDQHARKDGWELNFFDRPALTFPGAVKFAQRTGALIVPAFFHRQDWLKHKLKCYPPRRIDKDAPETELKAELQSLLELTEEEIKKEPADWMWLHKRWKTYS
ncbi:KDO2-lipid IV(A) lauroyltransferase [Halanaerobium saccharolyticum]|uniref:KDO2-lipid IV(A) lauroyltransferase n=1 Tax=Halanaerobium saccharolyticum TaxID=43595 RepID=A0A4R6M1J8_9FIRM|nr:lysophospholipid acyltransferase family protein [Halanaerobium saccharolyticum]TDO94796.1 KDO2-lipid IV(A) lauroyltransferase [Halanaerobium saccharolyticum]